MEMTRTNLMRVPENFKSVAEKLSKKYGYKSTTKFLENDGTKILRNADDLNDVFSLFLRRRKRV